ncbi:MAG: 3-oxoacyl-ACP reductase FabG [Caldilinea sp.]|nr:3-oxoacyl-ACP reductase FabG [Caldilinea sp.]MDW8440460.1 3-oxoacyl-ACP reductase family protein [Caldilineaceae bacterium]
MSALFRPDAFAGRRVLVTGGSRGIGRAITLAFARLGAEVAFCYRSDQGAAEALLREAATEGLRVQAYQADVADSAAVQQLVADVQSAVGPIDVLVNNAGFFPAATVLEMTAAEWDAVLRTNLYAVFYCSQAVLPGMIAAGGGAIINIASVAGQRGSARHAHYAAAKGGVLAFTRSLAREVIAYNIRVNAVSPGRIATELLISEENAQEYARWMADTPARRLGTVDEVADAVLFLASPASAYIVGETIAVNGGLLMD